MRSKPTIQALLLVAWCIANSANAENVTLTLGQNPEAHKAYPVLEQVVTRAFEIANVDLKIELYPAKRSLILANKGELDGEVSRLEHVAKEYPSLVPLNEPIIVTNFYAFIPKGVTCPKTQDDLLKKTTIRLLGFKYFELLEEQTQSKMETVYSLRQAGRMLDANRAFYIVLPKVAKQQIEDDANIQLKTCFDTPVLRVTFKTFLHKKHAHLVPRLDAAYKAAKQELNIYIDH